jgi:hypothetical protein
MQDASYMRSTGQKVNTQKGAPWAAAHVTRDVNIACVSTRCCRCTVRVPMRKPQHADIDCSRSLRCIRSVFEAGRDDAFIHSSMEGVESDTASAASAASAVSAERVAVQRGVKGNGSSFRCIRSVFEAGRDDEDAFIHFSMEGVERARAANAVLGAERVAVPRRQRKGGTAGVAQGGVGADLGAVFEVGYLEPCCVWRTQ